MAVDPVDGLEALELQLQSTDRDDPVFAGPGPIGLKADLLLTELGLREFSESRFFRFRIPFFLIPFSESRFFRFRIPVLPVH
jgi:hypothetical protein